MISVTSVSTSTFHKILASRPKSIKIDNRPKYIKTDNRQRAFRNFDGCFENTLLLELVLKYHKIKSRKLFMAVLNLGEAFDSVSLEAVMRSLRAKGVP